MDKIVINDIELFPSPREVHRFISMILNIEPKPQTSYRPLSRYIGLYLDYKTYSNKPRFELPSPPEVNRFISKALSKSMSAEFTFSSPLEVNRFISTLTFTRLYLARSFRPLARYIGLYHTRMRLCQLLKMLCYRPLAR